MLATLQAKLLVGSILAVLLVGAGYKWRDYQADVDELALSRLKSLQLEQLAKEKDAAAARLEDVLAHQRDARPKTIIVEKEIAKPVYSACGLPPDGVRLYNESIAARGLPTAR